MHEEYDFEDKLWELGIMTVYSHYMLELVMFVKRNECLFSLNGDPYSKMCTRNQSRISVPTHRT